MSRRFGWVLNLDAELELARGRPGYVPQKKLVAQLAEHGKGALGLLGPEDRLIASGSAAPDLVGRAWCPTPLALARLRAAGVEPEPHPDGQVLRAVNHRLFAHELGGGLPSQRYVRSEAELSVALAADARAWLLKRPLTFAGRGQLRVSGALTEKQWSWVRASLERDGLLVEPLVRPVLELSLHGFIWRDGRHELGRMCTQRVSERGAFRGVRLTTDDEVTSEETRAVLEEATRTARALFTAGYFGPFGIDAYRYELDGVRAFCALSEINARYTLGFATGFPRRTSELDHG